VLITLRAAWGEYDDEQYLYSPSSRCVSRQIPLQSNWRPRRWRAQHPLLFVARGFFTPTLPRIAELAELAQIPVLTTLKARALSPRITRNRWGCAEPWLRLPTALRPAVCHRRELSAGAL
jgi:hypothetical protein